MPNRGDSEQRNLRTRLTDEEWESLVSAAAKAGKELIWHEFVQDVGNQTIKIIKLLVGLVCTALALWAINSAKALDLLKFIL